MSIQKLIARLLPLDDLMATIKRFPLSVLCSVALFIIGIAITHDFIDDKAEWIGRLATILGCCYFWFGISKLISESEGVSTIKHILFSAVGAGAIAALFSLTSFWGINLFFVIPALLLGIMVAPYFMRGDDTSVWFFNRQMWFGVLVSYAALLMFAGGLSVALVAINILFDIKIDNKVYGDIWLFSSLVLGPIYALSWVPSKFEFNDDDCSDPPGLKFIVNWVSAPMVFIYLLILYAYFIKIIITGEVPNGHLAYMISGFVGAGIVTYMVAHPLRETGSFQLKLFYKILFPALIIPVAFHFYTIWERISAYGITEQRYMLLLSAVWFAIIALGNVFNKMPIRFIPMSLAILMALASFGPWGGVSVSGNSQFLRLEKLLVKNDLLVDGDIVKAKTDLSFDDRKNISSILDYICKSDRDDMIEPWFNVESKETWTCYSGRDLTKQLGFDYISHYKIQQRNDSRFNITSQHKPYMDIGGYDVLLKDASIYHYNLVNDEIWKRKWELDSGKETNMEYSNSVLSISVEDYNKIEINLHDFVAEKILLKENKQDLIIESENEDMVYRMVFRSFGGEIKDEEHIIDSMRFDFLYRVKR